MELDWEYKKAGLYQTFWYTNGYMYQIRKDPYRANEWDCFYKWHNWTSKSKWKSEWRPMSVGTQKTLKEAKMRCAEHNRNPREKYVYVKRRDVEDLRQVDPWYFEKNLKLFGYLVFRPKGLSWGSRNRYVNPKELGGEDVDARNEELIRRWQIICGGVGQTYYQARYEYREALKKIVEGFDGTLPLWDEGQRKENLDRLSLQRSS